MQHTLQQFVLDKPSDRRAFFEHLLNLDDISELIEKAVVGDVGIQHFSRTAGSRDLDRWRELTGMLNKNYGVDFGNARIEERDLSLQARTDEILAAANQCLLRSDHSDVEAAMVAADEMQRSERERRFPLLEDLRPEQTLDERLLAQLSARALDEPAHAIQESWTRLNTVRTADAEISEAQIAIASALDSLKRAGLLGDGKEQICPVCDHRDKPTLSSDRISQVSHWNELRSALKLANDNYKARRDDFIEIVSKLQESRKDLVPCGVIGPGFEAAEFIQRSQQFGDLKLTYESANDELAKFDRICTKLLTCLKSDGPTSELQTDAEQLQTLLPRVTARAREYASAFAAFEQHLGSMASADESYRARELWLKVANAREDFLADLRWEKAKRAAQRELDAIRTSLIDYRQRYLELRRQEFSRSIADIWSRLRGDSYSGFAQIMMPEPSGRGYNVRLEVKAMLGGPSRQIEVDALSVMSESQINVMGIAAFITRSKLLGHNCLVLDDPVQSMDDDHFKTFERDLIEFLCSCGFQVIVLTHNDRFAHDISHYHFDRAAYVTMKIEHSKRKGIQITQGNRRVAERLKIALKLGEDGDLSRAWYWIRIAIERLYTVAQIKHGPENFDPRSWTDPSADYMWVNGVRKIFSQFAPGSETRLKEILGFTAGGAHDRQVQGYTDLANAIKFVKPLPNKLRVGG